MDANLYVDGFNLYYRALRHTPWRWLDLQALAHCLLETEFTLHRIRYFTALIRSRSLDPQRHVSRRLRDAATSYRLLDHSRLPQCQLPITLLDSHGTITRPSAWQGSGER